MWSQTGLLLLLDVSMAGEEGGEWGGKKEQEIEEGRKDKKMKYGSRERERERRMRRMEGW